MCTTNLYLYTNMKTKNIFAILLIVLLVSCQTNYPEDKQLQESKTNFPGLKIKEHVPIMEWLESKEETVIHYSFVDYPSGICSKGVYYPTRDANTIMLNDRLGIRIQDTCVIDDSQGKNICHVTRKYEVIDKEEDTSLNQKSMMPARIQRSDDFSFDFTTTAVDPITILSPQPTDCNPIPMCYYHLMDIKWTPDSHHPTQMMIITEWNGLNMDGTSVNTTVVHHMETDDDGVVTLNDNIFNGMPDGALVNIWLVRENIVTIYSSGNQITPGNLMDHIEHHPEELTVLIHDHPELLYQLYSTEYVFGAIAHLPIFLIRESSEPIEERKDPIYK